MREKNKKLRHFEKYFFRCKTMQKAFYAHRNCHHCNIRVNIILLPTFLSQVIVLNIFKKVLPSETVVIRGLR